MRCPTGASVATFISFSRQYRKARAPLQTNQYDWWSRIVNGRPLSRVQKSNAFTLHDMGSQP
jgi:hypothetical protein